jgi:hypothetical protein
MKKPCFNAENAEQRSAQTGTGLNNPSNIVNAKRRKPFFSTLGIAAMALVLSSPSFALRNSDPDGPGGLDDPGGGFAFVTIEGSLTFQGCTPSSDDVTIRTSQPARISHPSAGMHYSIVIGTTDDDLPTEVTVTPQVSSSVCGSGSFAPGSLTVAPGARNVNFAYQAPLGKRFTIPVDSFVLFANGFLSNVGLHLNNDAGRAGRQNQNSHITINGTTSGFEIPVAKKGLPFPLPGSGLFYVRNMNKDDAHLSQNGSGNLFKLNLHFEQSGVEVKGYHTSLGDLAMPDSDAVLRVRNGKLGVAFLSSKLNAGIGSTGGCSVFGIDWCNFIFGTSGIIRRQFERSTLAQLQGATIQTALETSLAEALGGFGITDPIGTVAVENGQIVITTVCTSSSCGGSAFRDLGRLGGILLR